MRIRAPEHLDFEPARGFVINVPLIIVALALATGAAATALAIAWRLFHG